MGHIKVFVIVPHKKAAAHASAMRLFEESVAERFDYWGSEGRYSAIVNAIVEAGLVADNDNCASVPVRRLPSPVPEEMVAGAILTPDGRYYEGPLSLEVDKWPGWIHAYNEILDHYRSGHTGVVFDAHY